MTTYDNSAPTATAVREETTTAATQPLTRRPGRWLEGWNPEDTAQ